jgi:hypothetical protein
MAEAVAAFFLWGHSVGSEGLGNVETQCLPASSEEGEAGRVRGGRIKTFVQPRGSADGIRASGTVVRGGGRMTLTVRGIRRTVIPDRGQSRYWPRHRATLTGTRWRAITCA